MIAFLLAQTIAITGGTVYPVSGPKIENATVLIRDGRIAAVGTNVAVPAGATRAGVGQRLRRVLDDAREYATRRADYRRSQIQPLAASAADLEALQPVLRGELPLLVVANRRSDIETALRIAKEYKLRLILAGGAEGWMIPGEIAAAGVPVLGEPMDNSPTYDALGIRYENAPLLAKGGVKVALMETATEITHELL